MKWAIEPARAQDVPAAIARAYHVATQPPYGPVFVSVPADDWDAERDPVAARPRIPGFAPDPAALAALVAALDGSERPAHRGGARGRRRRRGPRPGRAGRTEHRPGVWASPMSLALLFPEDHPLFRGFLQPDGAGHRERARRPRSRRGARRAGVHLPRLPRRADLYLPPLFLVSDDEQVLARAGVGTGIRAGVRSSPCAR